MCVGGGGKKSSTLSCKGEGVTYRGGGGYEANSHNNKYKIINDQ